MFEKVLIAEDHESANISVKKTLAELNINPENYVYYCDDAFLRIKKAQLENQPYDLLITDLHFDEDHHIQKITSGTELIKAIKQIQPHLKILVFSAENKPSVIDNLFKEHGIDGYVRKARYDAQDLKIAIRTIATNKKYLSPDLRQSVREKNAYEFTAFDIEIITLLSQGKPQKDIPFYLQEKRIKPSGLSSVEKRLSYIKEQLDINKNEQLIAYCKDKDII